MLPLSKECIRSLDERESDLSKTQAGCVKVGVYCALKDVQRCGA